MDIENSKVFVCRVCGFHPRNRSEWCELGCGRDFNNMHEVALRNAFPAIVKELERLTILCDVKTANKDQLFEAEKEIDRLRKENEELKAAYQEANTIAKHSCEREIKREAQWQIAWAAIIEVEKNQSEGMYGWDDAVALKPQ